MMIRSETPMEKQQEAADSALNGMDRSIRTMDRNERFSRATGIAALSACEALVLALVDSGILDRTSAARAMEDAVNAHRNAEREAREPDLHRAAADLVEMIKRTVETP
jgi:hypothetical protein